LELQIKFLEDGWYALFKNDEIIIIRIISNVNNTKSFASVKHPTGLLDIEECITVNVTDEYVHLGRFRAIAHAKRDLPEYFV